jgi:hypothetical protein
LALSTHTIAIALYVYNPQVQQFAAMVKDNVAKGSTVGIPLPIGLEDLR